jgi:hypothetical protein
MMNKKIKNNVKAALAVCGLVCSFSAPVQADLNTGLIAHYSFDDCTATDSSGKANHGTLIGTQCVNGALGKALLFNGVSDYVEVPDSPTLNPTQLTMAAWVNPTALLNNENSILNKENQYEFTIFGDSGVVHDTSSYELASAFNPNWWWFHAGHFKPALGKYIHVAVTMDTYNHGKIYVNGVLKRDIAYSTPMQATANCLRIGARGCEPNSVAPWAFFNGIIDDVRLYKRALSVVEIKALYAQNVDVSGTMMGFKTTGFAVQCQNVTTGQTVAVASVAFNCEAAGLVVNPNDVIHINIDGKAK